MGSRTRSAGTEEIARRSGGDSLPVEDAQALDTTLMRIRQRYALHFLLPSGAKPGQERTIQVELTAAARRRHPDAEVRYRETYVPPDGVSSTATPDEPQDVEVSRTPSKGTSEDRETARDTQRPGLRRRPAVDDSYGSRSPNANSSSSGEQQGNGGWRRVDPQAAPAEAEPEPPAKQSSTAKPAAKPDAKSDDTEEPPQRGWRRVKPGEQP